MKSESAAKVLGLLDVIAVEIGELRGEVRETRSEMRRGFDRRGR